MKPILLDLFCGAGGCSMGYHRAGFEVIGVDIRPQPRYPFEFHRMDALSVLDSLAARGENAFIGRPDVIHTSPPCQAYSTTKGLHSNSYPMLIDAVRDLLSEIGKPYVIENVRGAPLKGAVMLCGSSFGLGVWRHRIFESNLLLLGPGCNHSLCPLPVDVTGTGGPCNSRQTGGGGLHRKPKSIDEARKVMGIDWMTRKEIVESIPPVYTEYIGKQIMQFLKNEAGA